VRGPTVVNKPKTMSDWFRDRTTEALIGLRKSVAGDTLREINDEIARREKSADFQRSRLDVY